MPNRNEIAQIAEQKGVTKTTIDKDWVLGHFVNAIYTLESLKNELIFKGGTCLRKCYFQDYRFSEDLDFTAKNKDFELTIDMLHELCHQVSRNTGVLLHIQSVKNLQYNNIKTGFQAEIKFWGADHSKNQKPPDPIRWQTKIKIEIILYEIVLFTPVSKEIFHPYTDKEKVVSKAICYDLAEVMSEKLRAMIQRSYTAPRDYYDVWYLSKNITFNWGQVIEAFHAKMKFKQLQFKGIDQLLGNGNLKPLELHWHTSLGAHLPSGQLPDFKLVLSDLELLFKKIFNNQPCT